ncbi:hypothetical protein MBRA1_001035 [Malassezia brasiliensis]|uniref:Oxo-4-hydroxy-4-carboxy-5-ureidoimidazoline decarboxylase domain-containing protein n=1 Tax=Malassezia brasiliensis TaxID=1821822 RepID=A0AAF0DUP7_9BASI|nr:hypothetical protein MBRA1_001035 [Malassezia brasiliensis]
MRVGVVPASEIPTAEARGLARTLQVLLYLPAYVARTLGEQCKEAIADLPEDSQPLTYDGLVDVARFCVEEEPGWSVQQQTQLLSGFPHVHGDARLTNLYDQFERQFPGLRYIAATNNRAQVTDELESILHRTASSGVHDPESAPWSSELERNMDALWEVAVDRATALEEGTLDMSDAPTETALSEAESQTVVSAASETPMQVVAEAAPVDTPAAAKTAAPTATEPAHAALPKPAESPSAPRSTSVTSEAPTSATSKTTGVPAAPASDPIAPPADDETQPFLSLASFRALALASPVLQKFFEHDLVHSIHLEPVQRSSTGGAFAWHAAPVAPRGTPKAVAGNTSKSSNGTMSLASTLIHGNAAPLDADTPASYSRDVTTGTRGKVVGFLGGLLGEEGKTRMDALADQVALRLQTHTVKGPLPSFASQTPTEPEKPKGLWGNAFMRGASAAAGAVTGEAGARPSLGGRLVGALRRQPSKTEQESVSSALAESEPKVAQDDDTLADKGPEAAVESLRVANEALSQERDTFVIDEVQSADPHGDADEDEHDVMNDAEDMDALGETETAKPDRTDWKGAKRNARKNYVTLRPNETSVQRT